MNTIPLKRPPAEDVAIPFPDLVSTVVASDLAQPLTLHLDAGPLPDRDEVIALVKLIRELLFPGYFGQQNLSAETLPFHVGELLCEIRARLGTQVANVLRHQAARHGGPPRDFEAAAKAVVQAFLETVPRLRATLATDVQAAFEGDPAAADTDEVIFSYPGVFVITVHRAAHELHRLKVPLIPRMMSEYAHALTGVDIHPNAAIGESFFIDHGTGVVIGETTIIGRQVKIYQGVTLGALSTWGGQSLRGVKRHPTLEDGVIVYAGASILGGETVIGREAVISSNVFITQSVPAHTRVTVKNLELRYRNRRAQDFEQKTPEDWVI